jgi:hypothetical protein
MKSEWNFIKVITFSYEIKLSEYGIKQFKYSHWWFWPQQIISTAKCKSQLMKQHTPLQVSFIKLKN